jgi:predicted regulator of Ras-like GTPase activity (Roadblock/LC7/MglB family)
MKTTFALPIEMVNQVEQILAHLLRMTEAECALLADTSGQLISMEGKMEAGDPAAVAALAVGGLRAMAELSRQVGEANPRGALLHEGERKSIYLLNVANSLILIVVFSADTLVGLVRLFSGRAVGQLRPLAAEFGRLLRQSSETDVTDFGAALSDELERVFGGL